MKQTNRPKETEIEICDVCHHHHPHFPAPVPDDEVLYRLADLFKVFGDPTRIRILYALSTGELCVCDIAQLLGMTQSAISHQLRVLKQMALVKFRRDGKPFTIPWQTPMCPPSWPRGWIMYRNKKEAASRDRRKSLCPAMRPLFL